MKTLITAATRKLFGASSKALLALAAATALTAGATAAQAWDQQATGTQMSYELGQRAAGGYGSAYAGAPGYFNAAPGYASPTTVRPELRIHRHLRAR
jgi:hypothetical protein